MANNASLDTSVQFLGKTFRNPVVLASGILGVTAASMKRCVDLGAGGVTIKSLSLKERTGHPNPTMGGYDHFFINAVGLSNAGVEAGVQEIFKYKEMIAEAGIDAPIIGSIFGGSLEEFGEVAAAICEAPIDILEIDISCPNVGEEFGSPFAYSTEAASAITRKVAEIAHAKNIPVSTKLSPNAWNIDEIALACKEAGADAVTAVNTVSGMTIDSTFQTPFLSNKVGGMSGPGLKPIALKSVWDIHHADPSLPIIGTGGVSTGEDAVEMMLAGATLVGVGSAVFWRGPETFGKIVSEIEAYMQANNVTAVTDLIGKAHKNNHAS